MVKSYIASVFLALLCHAALRGDVYNPIVKPGPFVGNLKFERNMVAAGHRLWGCEIVGQDLRNASFDNCDLSGVAFRQCELQGATFRNAVLSGLIVDDCYWGENDFTNAVINGIVRHSDSDTTGVTRESLLTTWSFQNKNLSKCIIPSDESNGYDFDQFEISEALLVNVKKALFTNCRLYGNVFESCDLTTCDFSKARFYHCTLKNCKVDYNKLKLSCEYFPEIGFLGEASVVESDFSRLVFGPKWFVSNKLEHGLNPTYVRPFGVTANFLNSTNLQTTGNFKTGNMANMTLIRCDFTGADFSRQVLVNTEFESCIFTDCRFDDAVMTNTQFQSCSLTQEQIQSTWNFKHGRMDSFLKR
jgi:uncharacterized protein YjbI with pentapeptide repeats